MAARRKNDYAPHIQVDKAPPCHVHGCRDPGIYKAPKSREALHDYLWFCLEHIREHNQKWDYFAGVESDEIEDFIRDAVTGHRPTWSRESRLSDPYRQLQNALYEFLAGLPKAPPTPSLPAKTRRALAVMEMTYPYTAKELKGKYRVMVKKHHPDMNKGDKRSEDIFKKVTSAYHHLSEQLKVEKVGG